MKFALVDGRPCPASVAPYVYLVLRRAGQTATSIYRGEDAKELLHAHGLHTQAEIHALYPTISNPAGHSEHELRSDGHANPKVPDGGKLEEWQVGIDSGSNSDADKKRIQDAAHHYGWRVKHPYTRGVEGHHWCFAVQPHPNGIVSAALIIAIRAKLAVVKAVHQVKPLNPFARTISPDGVKLIAGFEGFVGHAYQDAVGVWTIGYGHTRGVTSKTPPISAAEGRSLLRRDLNRVYAPAVNKACKAAGFKPTQHQFDALVSFAFNLGPGLLTGDHTIASALRRHARRAIADSFLLYDKAGNPPHALLGLTRRRKAERALFLTK